MNGSQTVSFLWTPATLCLSIVAVLVAAGFCFVAARRSGYRPAYVGLELFRFAIVCFAVVLLNQPEWIEEFRPEGKPTVAVLWDASASMETRRRGVARWKQSGPITRREAIAPLSDSHSWQSLEGRLSVGLEPVSAAPASRGTDLYTPLSESPDNPQFAGRGAGLGRRLERRQAARAGGRLVASKRDSHLCRHRGKPDAVAGRGGGQLGRATFGVVGKSVRIPFTLESSLSREYVTTVTLQTSDGETLSKEIHIAPMGRTTDSILWKPKRPATSPLRSRFR